MSGSRGQRDKRYGVARWRPLWRHRLVTAGWRPGSWCRGTITSWRVGARADGQVTGPDATLLEQLAGLAVDGLDPPDRVGPQIGVGKQPGQPDGAGSGEAVEGLRVGARQVERARPPVLVLQQRVPAAQVGQGRDPLLLGGPDEFQTPTVINLGHAGPPSDTRRSGYAALIAASHHRDDSGLLLSVAGRCDGLVVLFDGIQLGRHLRPSLTTVVQPMAALGDAAVSMLQDRIGGAAMPRRTLELPVRLELRGSGGCAE